MEEHLRILRLKQVENRTGLKRSTIYNRISLGTFPKQISLGGDRAIGWLESEINDWIQQRIANSRQGEVNHA
ncbi:MAG: AlpA family transcriptional regulator [Legionella sp.]|nr:MAG: AlpA family transcriptional regulator [Legionella sp.]PJD96550.1 MAG: AlpA family transcriptional regulator [Legionella sp.]